MKRILLAASFAILAFAQHVDAGNFTISPIRIELSPRAPLAAVTVRNADLSAPASIQTETMVWKQENGEDVYEPTRALVVSPPIFTLAPGAEQVVRIALRAEADATREMLYRVYFRELPSAPDGAENAGRTPTVHMVLRMGVPVIVAPASGTPAPKAVVRLETTSPDRRRVVLQNDGTAHLRVTNLVVTEAKSGAEVAKAGSFYVLPGRWWASSDFPAGVAAGGLKVTASTNSGDLDTTLPPAAP